MIINKQYQFKIKILKIYQETVSDGIGIRYSIYLAGCRHACLGCHNVLSWNPTLGELLTQEKLDSIISEINSNSILDGITLSGGDPFYNPTDLLMLLKYLKAKTKKNIWCYTGYTYEQLQNNKIMAECLEYIDVIVDGRFELEQRDLTLPFRGSKNQKIIELEKGKKVKEIF